MMWMLRGLLLLFIGLQLSGIIQWSWIWVVSPLLAEFGIRLLAIVTAMTLAAWVMRDERRR